MYVVLYLPADNDPEVFGPYATPGQAAQPLRSISTAAGTMINVAQSGSLATIDVYIAGERNRYQLLKVGSNDQLGIHAHIITEIARDEAVSAESADPLHPERGAGHLGG